jgi:hypothetical protein
MSAFGGKADIAVLERHVRLSGDWLCLTKMWSGNTPMVRHKWSEAQPLSLLSGEKGTGPDKHMPAYFSFEFFQFEF